MRVDWSAWRAHEPSADFADRVASAMMEERARWDEARNRSARRTRPRRAALALALAACTAAGVGWGLTRSTQPLAPEVSPELAPTKASLEVSGESRFAPVIQAEAEHEPARPASKLDRPASSSPSSSVPRLVLPRCVCAHAEAICGCLE